VGQKGFWDEQQRVAKLQDKKPVLKRLSDSIPWESFRPLVDQGYVLERINNAGRKRIDPLILFKMLVLQQLFKLSDEELEFQMNDRRSFEEFVGLGVMNSIPLAVRKDDAPAAVQAAMANAAGMVSISGGGGLIQTTPG
jgi:transposase, IS5 family